MVVKIGKEIFGDDFKKGDYLKRMKEKGTTKDLTKYTVKKININKKGKKAVGGSVKSQTDGMTLSPKADLDGDGTFSEYEKKRGMAIQNAMAKNKKPKTADAGTGKFLVKGMGVAIRGGLTKGSS